MNQMSRTEYEALRLSVFHDTFNLLPDEEKASIKRALKILDGIPNVGEETALEILGVLSMKIVEDD